MHLRVAINFRSGSEENSRVETLGEAKHVECTLSGCFDRLDRVVLVVRRAGRAGQVVNLVDLEHDRLDNIGHDEVEIRMPVPASDIFFAASEEIVHYGDLVTHGHELVDKIGANKACATSHQDADAFVGRQLLDRWEVRTSGVIECPLAQLLSNGFLKLRRMESELRAQRSWLVRATGRGGFGRGWFGRGLVVSPGFEMLRPWSRSRWRGRRLEIGCTRTKRSRAEPC